MKEFEELYTLYQKDVYYFLLKLSGYDDGLTEELVQEAFYQAFISFGRFRGECEVKTWICQIAKNTYYRYLREHVKQNSLKQKAVMGQEPKQVSAVVEEKIVSQHIKKAIEDLDERSRSIVEYRLFGELPFKEIGALIDLKDTTVKVLFSRAKMKIQTKLKEEHGYEI